MIYTKKLQEATRYSIAVHEEPVKQTRKGKGVPYITHPLTVGIILAKTGADEDVIAAGILHDTIEDCEPYGSVTKEILAEKFGSVVAELVDSVTEKDKSLTWHERKEVALEEIKHFSQNSLLVKSADVLSNNTELLQDYAEAGDDTFLRFNANPVVMTRHTLEVIQTIVTAWPQNPLVDDLTNVARRLQEVFAGKLMQAHPALQYEYEDFTADTVVTCPVCGWQGTREGNTEHYDGLMDVDCPICAKKVAIISYPQV